VEEKKNKAYFIPCVLAVFAAIPVVEEDKMASAVRILRICLWKEARCARVAEEGNGNKRRNSDNSINGLRRRKRVGG